jgi:capsular polysaccharide biosynthesis protein
MTTEQVFKSIFRHIVLVVLIPVFAVGITAFLCWNVLPKTYTAETSLYVLTQTNEDTLNYNELNLSTQLVNDYQELVESKRVKNGAGEMLGIDEKTMEQEYDIEVASTSSTRLIRLSVTGKSPAATANLANALAYQLSECIRDVANVENISIIDEATPPEQPSGPRSLANSAVAGVAGLAVSIVLALLIDLTNVRIRSREDVERILSLPVLAQIPVDNGK